VTASTPPPALGVRSPLVPRYHKPVLRAGACSSPQHRIITVTSPLFRHTAAESLQTVLCERKVGFGVSMVCKVRKGTSACASSPTSTRDRMRTEAIPALSLVRNFRCCRRRSMTQHLRVEALHLRSMTRRHLGPLGSVAGATSVKEALTAGARAIVSRTGRRRISAGSTEHTKGLKLTGL
jgi:hypothetical protein